MININSIFDIYSFDIEKFIEAVADNDTIYEIEFSLARKYPEGLLVTLAAFIHLIEGDNSLESSVGNDKKDDFIRIVNYIEGQGYSDSTIDEIVNVIKKNIPVPDSIK